MQGETHDDVGLGVGRRLVGLLTGGSPGVLVGVGLGRPAGCRGLDGCVAVAVGVAVAGGCFRLSVCVAVAVAVGVAVGGFGVCVAVAVAVAVGVAGGRFRLSVCVAVAVAVGVAVGGFGVCVAVAVAVGGWRLQVADFKVHRVGKRDFLIRIGLGVGNGQFKGIGARLTLPFYAQRNRAERSGGAVKRWRECPVSVQPLPFADVGTGIAATAQYVETVNYGGEFVSVVTIIVIVLIDAGEISEKETGAQVLSRRYRVVQQSGSY